MGGWWRKEGSSGPAGPPEKGGQKSVCRGLEPKLRSPHGPVGSRGWAPSPSPPGASGLRHQLTMGSTSASRSRSSWISSVLPESLLATELGDGEFLHRVEEESLSERSLGALTAQGQELEVVTPVIKNLS